MIKYLDQQNINNAYVSGMKEDLNLKGNELNLYDFLAIWSQTNRMLMNSRFTTYFNVAYCIMLIPSQVILTYIRPSYWLPGLEIVWGVLTGLIAMTTHAKQVYVLRVFLGLCESSAWPGMMTLLSKTSPVACIQAAYLLILFSVLVYANGACEAHGLLPFLPGRGPDDVWSTTGCNL